MSAIQYVVHRRKARQDSAEDLLWQLQNRRSLLLQLRCYECCSSSGRLGCSARGETRLQCAFLRAPTHCRHDAEFGLSTYLARELGAGCNENKAFCKFGHVMGKDIAPCAPAIAPTHGSYMGPTEATIRPLMVARPSLAPESDSDSDSESESELEQRELEVRRSPDDGGRARASGRPNPRASSSRPRGRRAALRSARQLSIAVPA